MGRIPSSHRSYYICQNFPATAIQFQAAAVIFLFYFCKKEITALKEERNKAIQKPKSSDPVPHYIKDTTHPERYQPTQNHPNQNFA